MRKRVAVHFIVLTVAVLLSACQGKKLAKARLTGIEQMKNQDYAGAVDTFDEALELSKGKVGEVELDVLKYRAEAEYQLEDYAAAVHTYGMLLVADGERSEYYLCRCLANVKAGELSAALSDYQKAAELIRAEQDTQAADQTKAGKDTQAAGIQAAQDTQAAEQLMGLLEQLEAQMNGQSEYRDALMGLYRQTLGVGYASGTIYNRMGLLLMESEDYDGAAALFEQGLTLADNQSKKDLLFNQAVAYEYKSDYQMALELFERYQAEFGSDEAVEKEIAFLKTR